MPCKRVEDGVFSTAEFKKFVESVVPFLHITTRIEDHPNDDLLYDFDENSFPAFLIIDADGGLLARHRESATLKEFQRTLAKVKARGELAKKAAAGDKAAAIDLALLDCELNAIDHADLEEQLEGKVLSDAQKKKFKGLAADEEVAEMIQLIQANKHRAAMLGDAGEAFAELLKGGGIPLGRRTGFYFWLGIGTYAWDLKKSELLERSLKELVPLAEGDRFFTYLRKELIKRRDGADK